MKKKSWIWIVAVIATLMAIYLLITLVTGQGKKESDISEFAPYISGYTSGVVSKTSSIKIQLSAKFAKKLGDIKNRPTDVFDFNPDIDGEAGWKDFRTIQFIPSENMKSNKEYKVIFKLVELDSDVDRKVREFVFNIKTRPQNFSYEITDIITTDKKHLKWQQVRGIVRTSDVAETSDVEKLIEARIDNKQMDVKCLQTDPRKYEFIIDSVPRKESSGQLKINFNGKSLGIDKTKSEYLPVPSLDDFVLMDTKIIQGTDQYVKLQFSDPIMENQYLDGLITISDAGIMNFSVKNNSILVYPNERIEGIHNITVNTGIKNILGYRLEKQYNKKLEFLKIHPSVRMIGEGVILPKAEGKLVLPFEAVNLKAVDIRISKIFDNNIMQFLQVNNYDDDYQIKRVARAVEKKTIKLDQTNVTNLGKWNKYFLDLNQLINADPGAIYRVEIGFRKKHAVYPCSEKSNDNDKLTKTLSGKKENDFWDNFENYYYSYNRSNWENRDNPCHEAYYGYRRAVKRNVFASNMGMIGKKANDGSLLIVVTDIISADPLKDVQVEIYNYQQQLISSKTTNKDGVAEFKIEDESNDAYFAVANHKENKAYLKLNDGKSLSISDFDVLGVDMSDGIKTFLYTERGVRRPGDSVYLGVMINDLRNKLPEGHPVIYELRNPRSQQIDRQVQHLHENHFHVFRSKTSEDDITGNYTAKIDLGGKTFYKSIPVETIKPNRLKIDFDIQNDELRAGKNNPVNIWINWLHGAQGKNLRTTVSMSLYPVTTTFDNYSSYHFDDITRSFSYNTTKIIDQKTDEEGHLFNDLKLNTINNAPGKLSAKLTIKAFEEGGNFSIKELQYPLHPYKSYVGIKLPESSRNHGNYLSTDKNHTVDIVTLDNSGEKVTDTRKLEVELLKSDWSWWYYSHKNKSNYKNSEHIDLIERDVITTHNGTADWDFEVDRDNWGYYILKITDPASGHSTSQKIYADWPEYAGVGRNKAKSAKILQFKTDKDKYQVEEEIKLKLPGSDGGRAFISIENGSKVLDYYWLETEKGETEFSIIAKENMTPNVYIHISLIQPHEQTDNDRPIRMYGVIPVKIENKETHLNPELNINDKLTAESTVELKVSESDRKDMTYTVAMVDEGLLSLTNFKTPDPWDYFYAREALGVKTWDIYDWVIGAYGGKIERLLSIGGGGSIDKEAARKSNRFTPVVKFLGPFDLKGGKTNTHKIKLPRYVGAVRTMVVAGNTEGAYGSTEKTSKVTKPLMVLGSMPRVLGPGEEINLPVTVFAMEDNVKNANIQIKTNDLLSVDGASSKSVSFDKPGEKTIDFPVKVNNKTGKATVKIHAVSGNEKSTYSVEIDVRNPNPPMTEVEGAAISKNSDWQFTFDQFGIEGSGSTTLEVYSIPPINLSKRLKYLMDYPHGCVEQLVSSAFPQLYINEFINLSAKQKSKTKKNVEKAIDKLRHYQMSNGGFSYWPGSDNTNLWGTNYAGHFLIEAKNMGYDVPDVILKNWLDYQKKKAVKWTNDGKTSQFIQSYRLYTLALAGKPKRSAMNRLRQTEGLYEKAAWRLAAAYKLTGKKSIASHLINNLPRNVKPYMYGATFGSSVRDEAMILETLVLLDKKQEAFSVLKNISDELGKDSWMSTQTTAYALIAISDYIEKYSITDEINISYKLNNKDKKSRNSKNAVLQIPLSDIKKEGNSISVSNNTDGILYARLVRDGIPKPGSENASSSRISMDVNFTYPDGKYLNPEKIKQGTDFVCEIKVKHKGYESDYQDIALSQIFPSGWEIINSRMFSTQIGSNSSLDYQDIRDDRVYTYFDIYKGKVKTYRIMLNASYAGKFYMPAFSAEAMYDKSIHARNKGKWVEVVRQ